MSSHQDAIRYLKAIEEKHKDYFETSKLSVLNCVVLKGTSTITVHVTNNDLPAEIIYDIETMFWID